MGLKLQKQIDNTGFFVEYWKISKIQFDYISNKGWFELSAYRSKEDRDSGKNPIEGMNQTFMIDSLEEIRDTLYSIAKAANAITTEGGESIANEFANSTDC